MTPQESRLIEAYRARLAEDQQHNYRDLRHGVDPNDPDCRTAIETLLDNHPDPRLSRKGLCADCQIHEDSLRKFLANRYGPPFGLVERLMRLTRCYKPLYWLARRCGFILIPDAAQTWDRRHKAPELVAIERTWLDLNLALNQMGTKNAPLPGAFLNKQRRTALDKIRALQEQLQGLRLSVESVDPQISLFPEAGDSLK